jgi:hypothetical protein
VTCSRANATATCSTGRCRIASCIRGWGDCDDRDSNGCERSLDSNSHCGRCGEVCGSDQSCVEGVCR